MTDPTPYRPVPRWQHAWAIATCVLTGVLLALGSVVTTFRVGMADPIWPTEPWYLIDNYKLEFGYLVEHCHRIAGWLVGGFSAVLAVAIWWNEPRSWARWIGAASLVALLAAYGQFHGEMRKQIDATQIAWPMQLVWTMAGSMSVVLLVGATGVAGGVRGSGLRIATVLVLVAVMIQGLLGGFRVRLNELVGTDLAAIHGTFGQAVFALLVCVTVLTAPRREADDVSWEDRRRIGRTAVLLAILTFNQVVWGAVVRHTDAPHAQRMHLLTAFAVFGLTVVVVKNSLAVPALKARLQFTAHLLTAFLTVQILLGVEAWLGKYLGVIDPQTMEVTQSQAIVRCAHVLVGYGVMSTTVVLAVLAYRGSRSAVEVAADRNSPAYDGSREPVLAGRTGGSA